MRTPTLHALQKIRDTRLWKIGRRVKRQCERALGYRRDDWLRVRQLDDWRAFLIGQAELHRWNCLEVSPAAKSPWATIGFGQYTSVSYPEFDICRMRLPLGFDVVIADQVFEHLKDPLEGVRNARAMLVEGGWFLIATPFLFRAHDRPGDYTRWTADGLTELLVKAGFSRTEIDARSWGNRACVRAHIGSKRVLPYGLWRRMANDPEYPVMVWAFARKAGN